MAIKRIGDILIDKRIITEKQLKTALSKQKGSERIGKTLIRLKIVSEMQILKALEESTGVSRISLSNYVIDEKALSLIDEEFCRQKIIIPLKIEGHNFLFATSEPQDFEVVEELRMMTGLRPKPFSATKNDIITQIEKLYGFTKSLEALGIKSSIVSDEVYDEEDESDETPMVKLVNQILTSAVFQRASDIHIDPLDDQVLIRYRVDGVLDVVREFPIKILNQMVSRIKVMSGMDITETRVPQDGRIQTLVQQKNIDLRISTLPTIRGEKVVMRILNLSDSMNKIEAIGLAEKEEQQIRKMIAQPNGIMLVSGPTGSGKTTTLYACLNELNKPDVNIVTVEDPVEIKMTGVNQVQVRSEVNLTFAKALRSILRQDPNIIMIGEIRDVETAEIAIRASLTGHLVLSTIHTNDAVKTIIRLADMEIEPFLIASSLMGVIAQRLVRNLCSECSYESEVSLIEKKIFEKNGMKVDTIRRAKGCSSCNQKGFSGRVGIFEVLLISKVMQEMIANGSSAQDLEKQAVKDGMVKLIKSGLLKVEAGITTFEEVMTLASELEG